jgi:hypothetical protein
MDGMMRKPNCRIAHLHDSIDTVQFSVGRVIPFSADRLLVIPFSADRV